MLKEDQINTTQQPGWYEEAPERSHLNELWYFFLPKDSGPKVNTVTDLIQPWVTDLGRKKTGSYQNWKQYKILYNNNNNIFISFSIYFNINLLLYHYNKSS